MSRVVYSSRMISFPWWVVPAGLLVLAFLGAWLISGFERKSDYGMDVINLLFVVSWFVLCIASAIGIVIGHWMS